MSHQYHVKRLTVPAMREQLAICQEEKRRLLAINWLMPYIGNEYWYELSECIVILKANLRVYDKEDMPRNWCGIPLSHLA